MKTYFQTNTLPKTVLMVAALALILIAGFYACKKQPTDGINLIVDTGPLSVAPTLVTFANANPASTTVLPTTFPVTISGPGAQYVQVDGGGTNFTVSHGFLPLSLVKGVVPSKSNPITFNVYASVPGFAPVSTAVILTKDSSSVKTVSLVEYANLPSGTSLLNTTTALNAGVSAAVQLTTSTTASLAETATLSIPAGTTMLDANGAVINASQLSSTIVQYGTSSPAATAAFPGGLSPTNVLDANGNPIPGGVNFVSAGLLSINMLAGTTTVKSFSKPIQMTIELQSGLINFITGNPVQAGDVIPLWSLNETTGQWKNEGTATVALDAKGKLAATGSISHLTAWNMDWYWYPPTYGTISHSLAINLNPSSTPWNAISYDQYYVELETANGNYLKGFSYTPQTDFFQSTYYYSLTSIYGYGIFDTYTIYGKYGFGLSAVPNIGAAKVVVYDLYNNYNIVGQSSVFNPTTASSVTVNVNTPAPPSYINVSLNMAGHCSSKNVTAKPTGWFYLYDYTAALAGQYGWSYEYLYNGAIYYSYGTQLTNTNGTYSIQLITGHQYYLYTFTNNTWYDSPVFSLSKSNFSINTGGAITITGTYTAANNTLNIGGNFSLGCN